jgi:hypothetical protein
MRTRKILTPQNVKFRTVAVQTDLTTPHTTKPAYHFRIRTNTKHRHTFTEGCSRKLNNEVSLKHD